MNHIVSEVPITEELDKLVVKIAKKQNLSYELVYHIFRQDCCTVKQFCEITGVTPVMVMRCVKGFARNKLKFVSPFPQSRAKNPLFVLLDDNAYQAIINFLNK